MSNTPIVLPIYISTSETLKGIRCIKAARDIKKGELIESCPIILIPISEFEHYEKTVLTNYDYDWDKEYGAFVLGYCVLTNHSFSSNATFERNFTEKKMEYYAVKDIKKDEEIFINYNGDPDDTTPLEHAGHTNFKL
ncbi:MAG: SET domain-containing protein [Candidatus Roizmanbacteria bacterium]|nr:SET domain-containing protein [Candidatus Roizmanbacteria bacterium]